MKIRIVMSCFIMLMLEAHAVANKKRPSDSFGVIEPVVEKKEVCAAKKSAPTLIPPKPPKIDRCVLNKDVKSAILLDGRKVGEMSIVAGTLVKIEKVLREKLRVSGNNTTTIVSMNDTDYPIRKARLEQFSFVRPCLEDLTMEQIADRMQICSAALSPAPEDGIDEFLKKGECDATSFIMFGGSIIAEDLKNHLIKFELLIVDYNSKEIKKVNCEHDNRALISIQLKKELNKNKTRGVVRLRKTKLLGIEIVDFILDQELNSMRGMLERIVENSDPLASTGISPAMFKADITSLPVVVAAVTKIDDYYNYEFHDLRKDYWSISIEAKTGEKYGTESFHGYVYKNSEMGRRIREFLQDGKSHAALVKLAHPKNAESSDCCLILAFRLL